MRPRVARRLLGGLNYTGMAAAGCGAKLADRAGVGYREVRVMADVGV